MACWAEPPEFRVQSVPDSEFFLRNIKSAKTIEIRRARDFKLVWKVQIDDYDDLFSSFRLSPGGKSLVHIKGNHMISNLNEVCIDIYGTSGSRNSYKVQELRKSLPKYEPESRSSIDPQYRWFQQIGNVSDETLVVRLEEKTYAWLSIKAHRVEIHR
jgi:hypothetical protein